MLNDLIDTETLIQFDEKIEIKSDLQALGEIKNYYVPRRLSYQTIIK